MEISSHCWYPFPTFDLFSLYILGLVMAPLFLLFVALPFKLVFAFISFLFDRYTSEPQGCFDACEYVLKNLAARYGGVFYKFNSRRLVCLLPERHLFLEVDRNVLVGLRIHKEYPHKTTIWKRQIRFGEVSHDRMIAWIQCAEKLVEKPVEFPTEPAHWRPAMCLLQRMVGIKHSHRTLLPMQCTLSSGLFSN